MADYKTEVKPCNCKSDFQDQKYGKGNRLHNQAKQGDSKSKTWHCTVCGKST